MVMAAFACLAVICLLFPVINAVDSDTQKQIDALLNIVQTQSRRIDELESLLDVDAIRRAAVQEQTHQSEHQDEHVHNVDANKRRLAVEAFPRCSNTKWSVESLSPVKERPGYPAVNAFDGKTDNSAGKPFISMTSKDITFVIDLGQVEHFTQARFYGVNDGDQAEHAAILCGNFPDGKSEKWLAEVDIPRKPVWVRTTSFSCTNRYVTFYIRDAHSHSSNIRLQEIQLYGCKGKLPGPPKPPKKCPAYYKKYADGAQAATPIVSEKIFSGNVKDTVVLEDLRVGQYDDFVLEADIWVDAVGAFNTVITHHLKSHGTTCNQGTSYNVNVGYTLYVHGSGDIKFLMGTGKGTTRDVDLNGGKIKLKTWTKLKVTFLKGVATLYVNCAPQGSAKFKTGEPQIGATIPTKIGQYGCDNLKSVFKGKMRFASIYKPTAPRYFPSAKDYIKNKGVFLKTENSVITLGKQSDIALVRTGPGRAAFIGDISFSGGVVAKMVTDIRGLKGQLAALRKQTMPAWMHGKGEFKVSDYASSKLELFKDWGGESKFAARGVEVDGDGNVIVVGNGAQSGVKKYWVANNQWTTVSKGGTNLWGLALCPNGNIYYVSRGSYEIMAVDCKSSDLGDGTCSSYSKAYTFRNMIPQQPYFVTCNVDNDLAVAEVYNKQDSGNGAVHYYDAQRKKWSEIGHDAGYAVGISFAPSGDIYYITDHASKKLNEIRRIQCMDGRPWGAGQACSKYEEVVKPLSKIGDSHGWGNLVVTGDGSILYNEKTGHWIGYYKEGMDSPKQVPHNKNGGAITHPWGMAVSPNGGDIYVSDYGQGKVWVIRKS